MGFPVSPTLDLPDLYPASPESFLLGEAAPPPALSDQADTLFLRRVLVRLLRLLATPWLPLAREGSEVSSMFIGHRL